MSALILRPGAQAVEALASAKRTPLPLDAILVVQHGDMILQSLSAALSEVARSPWVPLVVVSPHATPGPLRFDIGGICLRALTVQLIQGEALDPLALRAAVRARGKPTAGELVEFIVRAHDAGVAPILVKALAGAPLRRSEHAKLLAATGLGADAWENLHECLGCIADCWRDPRSVEALAEAHKVSPKTVWGRCQRFFGMTWREACAWSAWEALVERAVQPRVGCDMSPS